MSIMKNVLFWSLAALLVLFVLFLTASLLFLFYPEAFSSINKAKDNICPVEQFPCGDSLINGTNKVICLERVLHCNGDADCPNGEDELNCVDNSGRFGKAFVLIHQQLKNGTKLTQEYAPKHCTIEMYFKGECSCNLSDDRIVFCENSSLTQIPDNLNLNITKLVLNNNTITQINVTILSQYSQLQSLYLDNNNISELPANPFIGLKKLRNLSLRGNRLHVISNNHFTGLTQLRMLYLEYNNIIEFDLSSLTQTSSLKLLVVGHNQFNLDGQKFPSLPHLSWLVLDNNRITYIDVQLFRNLPKLKTLHMKMNRIKDISSHAFSNNSVLQELDLSENRLNSNINDDTFKGLRSLNKLDLKNNVIRSLPMSIFHDLPSLESLDLRGITIDNIDLEHFSHCIKLQHIYFLRFRYCSYAPRVRICRPITDGLSSAEHLLVLPVLRYSVWVVAFVTCVGNIVVLIWRSVSKKEDHVLSLFIKNLSAADLLMGIYLCAIGAHDLAFRDNYRRHALSWMSSWSCTTCGFMAMLSSQVSVFTLALITIERYRCITANFRVVTIFAAKINLAVVWILAIVLASYPVAYYTTTGDGVFYASNGLCFPLHIDDPYMTGWQYSALVFLGINFPAVLLIITMYCSMFCIIKRDRKLSRPVFIGRKREDAILALRFFGIVVTDCLCWIPIVIIKILALVQTPISSNVYAWVVVFVLPINSALNPIIYTLAAPTELRRRIIKWCQQTIHSILFECSFITDGKTEQNTSSMISHTSLTAATELRSSNGSAVSLPMTLHSTHSGRGFHHTIRTIRL